MTREERLELAEAARAHVSEATRLLEWPSIESLEQSGAELTMAIARIRALQGALVGLPMACPSKASLMALRKDLWRLSGLLRAAWAFRAGRQQTEYTEKGEWRPGPVSTVRLALDA